MGCAVHHRLDSHETINKNNMYKDTYMATGKTTRCQFKNIAIYTLKRKSLKVMNPFYSNPLFLETFANYRSHYMVDMQIGRNLIRGSSKLPPLLPQF